MLSNLGKKYNTDKVEHGFTNIYENILNQYKEDEFNFLEIGVFYGSSIKMWNEYFTKAKLYAADYYKGVNGNKSSFENPEKFVHEVNNNKDLYDRVNIVYLNQANEQELIDFRNKCLTENTKFKVILDDGSHLMKDQQLTFYHLFDVLESGGIFIMEDTHTSEDLNGYDVLPDKSNSTKQMFLHMKNGGELNSIYFNHSEKCREITSLIDKIEHYKVKENSETTIIYKK